MGFSITGIIFATIILAPNLLMLFFPPHNIPAELRDAGIVFTVLERVGQAGCLILLAFSKTSFQNRSLNLFFALSVICIACYYGLWVRYAVTGRDFAALFNPVLIPIPMAVLPILALGFIAVWGKSVWLGIADVIFAIGHIANSWIAYNSIK